MLQIITQDIAEQQSQARLQSDDPAVRTAEVAARVARAAATGGVVKDITHDATSPESFHRQWIGQGYADRSDFDPGSLKQALQDFGLRVGIEVDPLVDDGKISKTTYDAAVSAKKQFLADPEFRQNYLNGRAEERRKMLTANYLLGLEVSK